MLIGNAGIITAISSLIVSLVDSGSGSSLRLRMLVLIAGIVGLWLLSHSSFIESRLANLISKVLRRSSSLAVYDYASMLHLAGEYRISEIGVSDDHWLCGKTLRECGLRQEGVMILGITREDGTFLGTPQPTTKIRANDSLIVYGRAESLEKIKRRREGVQGNAEHEESMRTQDEEIRKEQRLDEESQRSGG
jgi:NhaP-type Na+/H+ and K+/H+ antiporter